MSENGTMTLSEAIDHAEQKAKTPGECGKEHKQLAEWLKDYQKTLDENKQLKSVIEKIAATITDRFCPAWKINSFECPLGITDHGKCTLERAQQCWLEYWTGDGKR